MARQKAYFSVIVMIFLLWSCEKQKLIEKGPIHYIITVTNPVTGEGYSGVYYEVIETHIEDPGLGATIKETVIASGESDLSGKAVVTFNKKYVTNSNYLVYSYGVDVSVGDIGGQEYGLVHSEIKVPLDTNQNKYGFNYEVLPYGKFDVHIKNINCQGPSDEMRYRTKYLYPNDYLHGEWGDWISNNFNGCYEYTSTSALKEFQNYRVTQMEITRNGQKTYQLDTFYIDPDPPIETLELFY